MFGIVATVVVGVLVVVTLVRLVLAIVKPNQKSISETMRDNDEKYE